MYIRIWTAEKPEGIKLPVIAGCNLEFDRPGKVSPEEIPPFVYFSKGNVRYMSKIGTASVPEGTGMRTLRGFADRVCSDFDGMWDVLEETEEKIADFRPDLPDENFPPLGEYTEFACLSVYFTPGKEKAGLREELLKLISRIFPYALPERFGRNVPPEFSFSETGKEGLLGFLAEDERPVVYPRFPVTNLFLRETAKDAGECGYITMEMPAFLLDSEAKAEALTRLMKEASSLYSAFFSQIVRGGKPVKGGKWQGIPDNTGVACLFGDLYSDAVSETGRVFEGGELPDIKPEFRVSVKKTGLFRKSVLTVPAERIPDGCFAVQREDE